MILHINVFLSYKLLDPLHGSFGLYHELLELRKSVSHLVGLQRDGHHLELSHSAEHGIVRVFKDLVLLHESLEVVLIGKVNSIVEDILFLL